VTPATGPEAAFQQQVIEIAHIYRWRVAHFRAAQTARGWRTPVEADGMGFPDLVLIRPPELIIAELKSEKGVLSLAQRGWVGELSLVEEAIATAAGQPPHRRLFEINVWRPSDFDDIVKRLSRPYLHPVEGAAA
jgi:hypothetical protein